VTNTLPLVSTAEALRLSGLTPRVLNYWCDHGTITPSQPPAGRGSRTGYSLAEVAALTALARVRADLLALGLSVPRTVIGALWDQLTEVGYAGLSGSGGTVNIVVRIEEGR
jgi:hypothetical protein